MQNKVDADENAIGKQVIDAAITVHKELGPGLLETVYEVMLFDELQKEALKLINRSKFPFYVAE